MEVLQATLFSKKIKRKYDERYEHDVEELNIRDKIKKKIFKSKKVSRFKPMMDKKNK